ncbi:T9SS type A sorting domain-containing protein [candidate division KSB1 bacterium]|nr:T9SS type A sorting domain-containing protein [candidate division KSB1 bacterium]
MNTRDGGETWKIQKHELKIAYGYEDLQACSFINKMQGWCVSFEGNVICTKNGGNDWITLPKPTDNVLWGICFIDSLTGWVVGRQGTIFSTTNGGLSWTDQSLEISKSLEDVHFVNKDAGWIVGSNNFLASTVNGGERWTIESTNLDNTGLFNTITFISADTGWIAGGSIGYFRTLLKTTDGGVTWNPAIDPFGGDLFDISFANSRVGWAVGEKGTILNTIDGGETWNWQMNFPSASLNSVQFLDERTGWATGGFSLIKTTDGGDTWQYIDKMEGNQLFFIDSHKGWLVHAREGIYNTVDGGQTWQHQLSKPGYHQIQFIDENNGWATGAASDSTYIIRTGNGGKAWTELFVAHDYSLSHFFFIDSLHGWLFGSQDVIMATDDGGKSWEIQQDKNSKWGLYAVMDMCFVDSLYGWGCGTDSRLWHTEDGGKTWIQRYNPNYDDFTTVHFFDRNEGWLAGILTLQHTIDGGQTWQEENLYKYFWSDLSFTDRDHGWAVGIHGVVARYENSTWVIQGDDKQHPADFKLNQNYPNPFNPATHIPFSLPGQGTIRIAVFDLMGREIATLVDNSMSAGNYVVDWNGKDTWGQPAPSGSYFYQAIFNGQTMTKKMLLVK